MIDWDKVWACGGRKNIYDLSRAWPRIKAQLDEQSGAITDPALREWASSVGELLGALVGATEDSASSASASLQGICESRGRTTW